MNTVRKIGLILLILILVFGSFFLFDLQNQQLELQTASPRYSASVAWLEMCAEYLSGQMDSFTWS